ncbi:MAG TPA: 30S ribosomal protein S9 [archaeon]|nr:30S ribosomal protein S9 [archaeon]
MVKKQKDKPTSRIVTGKRKIAIARAFVTDGTGKVRMNSIPLENWGSEYLRLWISEPLVLAGDVANKVDVDVTVKSGGIVGQAEAARMSIAKSLVNHFKDKNLYATYMQYDRNLLVYDPRRNEMHHGSGRGASKRGSRRHKQRSKR